MQHTLRIVSVAASLAFSTLSASVLAQTAVPHKATCQSFGTALPEPIGDREGHAISVSQFSCRVEGGPLDGGVLSGAGIYEWDKGVAVTVSGNGVARKPGAMAIYQVVEQKTTLTMTDGKVTGFTGTSKGVYKLGTGSAASLTGKSFTSTYKTVGGGQWVIESTMD